MIVSMKKIHLIVHKKDVVYALEEIRDLGILHVEHQDVISGNHLDERREEVGVIHRTIDILRQLKLDVIQTKAMDWKEVTNTILHAQGEVDELKEKMTKRQQLINQWEPWGDFNPDDIRKLADEKIFLELYQIPAASMDKLKGDFLLTTIGVKAGVALCVIVSRSKTNLPFEKVVLPQFGLGVMKAMQDEDRIKMEQAQKRIADQACYIEFLEMTLKERENILHFEEVEQGMREDGPIAVLKGFCPVNTVEYIERRAKEQRWALLIEDPADDDLVPTLTKNPKWIDIIKPIFGIMNIVPGYREKDISVFFLIFFSIFFGILVGDAGYGMIFLVLTAVGHITVGKKVDDHAFFYLSYLLSTMTIIWGVLTGTVFGTLLLSSYFKPVLPWLTDPKNVQFLCFLLGVVHLTIAHIWRSISRGANLGGLAEIGWIMMLWGSFFLANMMLLGHALPGFVKFLYIIGIIFVVIDIIAQKKDIGVNMILFVFSVINTFGDIVSYIRLFAVGLAGVAVADAFNQMALGIGFGNIFTTIGAVFVLGFVHLFLNLALCVMSVLVHGVRLNVLEFSGHLGMEWSGIKYIPFAKIRKS